MKTNHTRILVSEPAFVASETTRPAESGNQASVHRERDLWLGPSMPRPYHSRYTHAVFRGWYEFGGGAIADMGHYSLWPVFHEFDMDNLSHCDQRFPLVQCPILERQVRYTLEVNGIPGEHGHLVGNGDRGNA